jgi:uncharacterized protein (DUF697 family)
MSLIKTNKMNTAKVLNNIYNLAVTGNGSFGNSIQELADEYVERYGRTEKAIDKMVSNQRLKCTATGFVSGLGGLVTLPITIPADLASSLYIEIRMIATVAAIRGYDINSDEVKTLVYLCIVGNSVGDVLKQAGLKSLTNYSAKVLIPKISKAVTAKVAENVGNKLLLKTSTKVLPKLGKMVPVVGGVLSGSYNYAEISAFAKVAKNRFN